MTRKSWKTHIVSGRDRKEEGDGDDPDSEPEVDSTLVLQLGGDPGELERDVDGEDDQAEGGEEVVEGEEEGVEGAVGRGLIPVVLHVVLHEERRDKAAVQEVNNCHSRNHWKGRYQLEFMGLLVCAWHAFVYDGIRDRKYFQKSTLKVKLWS